MANKSQKGGKKGGSKKKKKGSSKKKKQERLSKVKGNTPNPKERRTKLK